VDVHHWESIRYYTFETITNNYVDHAIFTRQGGFSSGHWAKLNLGGTVGDNPHHVKQNRILALQALGRNMASIYDVWQVHSTLVVCTNSPRSINNPHIKADAIITDRQGVTLFMRFADCVPILLYDPMKSVVGIVHAGWQGSINRIAHSAVRAMTQVYRSRPENIQAAIGPSIGKHHYKIGQEVAEEVERAFGLDSADVLEKSSDYIKFDLWVANEIALREAGVTHIEVAGVCTACNLGEWYSHRGENGKTGRFGVFIGLK